MILGKLPYIASEEFTLLEMYSLIKNVDFERVIREKVKPRGYSDELCDLLNLLCTKDVENRPKLDVLKETSIYQRYKDVREDDIVMAMEKTFGNLV